MTQKRKAIFYLVLTAILWSSSGVLIKWIDWPPISIAGGRSMIAAIIIWFAFRKEKLTFSKPQLAGAIAYCACVVLFVTATKLTTAANAILLQYTAPIYVALLSGWLLGETVSRSDWYTIFVVCCGMLFFFLDKVTAGGMLGNLYAIASGISFALFILFMRMQKDDSPYGSVLLGNLLTFALSLFFWSDNAINVTTVIGISLLGIFQLGASYVLYTHAIRYVEALEATLITSIEPILNPIWVFLLFSEQPGLYSMIGGLIVLTAITVRYWFDSKSQSEEYQA
jgi:drug/metabolite transporter (DMT)-like permease